MCGGASSLLEPRLNARLTFVRAWGVQLQRARRYGRFSSLCALFSPAKSFSSLHNAQRAQRSKKCLFRRGAQPPLAICARSLFPTPRPLDTFPPSLCENHGEEMRKNRLLSPESSRLFFGTCGVYRYASAPARRLVHFATLARIRTRAHPTFFRFLPSPFTFGCNTL